MHFIASLKSIFEALFSYIFTIYGINSKIVLYLTLSLRTCEFESSPHQNSNNRNMYHEFFGIDIETVLYMMTGKWFLSYWTFVREIHQWLVDSPQKASNV